MSSPEPDVELLRIEAAGRALAIPAARVVRVVDHRAWSGEAPLDLGRLIDPGSPSDLITRVILVETAAGTIPVAVRAVHSFAEIAPSELLPLPARVRRHALALSALVLLPAGPTLVIDPDALAPAPASP